MVVVVAVVVGLELEVVLLHDGGVVDVRKPGSTKDYVQIFVNFILTTYFF